MILPSDWLASAIENHLYSFGAAAGRLENFDSDARETREFLEVAWALAEGGDLDALADHLPRLLDRCRDIASCLVNFALGPEGYDESSVPIGRITHWNLVIEIYLFASAIMTDIGRVDLALSAAERALSFQLRFAWQQKPFLTALNRVLPRYRMAMALLEANRNEASLSAGNASLTALIIENVDEFQTRARLPHERDLMVSIEGAVFLCAALALARIGQKIEAMSAINRAESLAKLIPADANCGHTEFNSLTVLMTSVGVLNTLKKPLEALQLVPYNGNLDQDCYREIRLKLETNRISKRKRLSFWLDLTMAAFSAGPHHFKRFFESLYQAYEISAAAVENESVVGDMLSETAESENYTELTLSQRRLRAKILHKEASQNVDAALYPPYRSLDFKIAPDNARGATGYADLRWASYARARHIIGVPDPSPATEFDRVNDWCAGRIGDASFVDIAEHEQVFLERRMFAVMWTRSCALRGRDQLDESPRPLDEHFYWFEKYADGQIDFKRLLFAMEGWALGEIPFYLDYDNSEQTGQRGTEPPAIDYDSIPF